jgi:hypothetical protein
MSKQKSGYGWIVGFFILLVLLAVTVTTNYQKSDKIKYLNGQLNTAQQASQQTTSNTPSTSTPTVTTPSLTQPTTTKQSWLCTDSVDMNLGGDINALCTPSDGSTNDLSCSGNINTDLVTQYYPYANLNMTCTTQ